MKADVEESLDLEKAEKPTNFHRQNGSRGMVRQPVNQMDRFCARNKPMHYNTIHSSEEGLRRYLDSREPANWQSFDRWCQVLGVLTNLATRLKPAVRLQANKKVQFGREIAQ